MRNKVKLVATLNFPDGLTDSFEIVLPADTKLSNLTLVVSVAVHEQHMISGEATLTGVKYYV